MEIQDLPDGHLDTITHKFGSTYAERWIPVVIDPDETPTATQKLVEVETVTATTVTYLMKAIDLTVDEQKSKDAITEGALHKAAMSTLFTSMKGATAPTGEEIRKALLFLLAEAGITE